MANSTAACTASVCGQGRRDEADPDPYLKSLHARWALADDATRASTALGGLLVCSDVRRRPHRFTGRKGPSATAAPNGPERTGGIRLKQADTTGTFAGHHTWFTRN